MASVMYIMRFNLAEVSSSLPSIMPCGMPGIIDAIFDIDPLQVSRVYVTQVYERIGAKK